MADDLITLQKAQEMLEKLKDRGMDAGDALESLRGKIPTDIFNKMADSISRSASELGKLIGMTGVTERTIKDAYGSIQKSVETYAAAASEANRESSGRLAETAAVIGTVLMPKMTEGMIAFETFGKIGSGASTDVNKSMNTLISSMPAGVQELMRLGESAQQARMGFYSLLQESASTAGIMGELGSGVESAAIDMDQFNVAMASMSTRLEEVGKKALLAPEQVQELLAVYGQMPGALNAIADASDGAGERMDGMVQSVMLARGLGMDQMKVVERQRDAMFAWGTSIEQTNDNLIMMNRVGKEVGINRDIMLSFIDSATQGMGILGDKTKSAILVMESLGKVMKDNGMGARAVGDLLSGTMQNMTGLNEGQAAFISQMSGGPGGLAGVMEIEALKQDESGEGLAQILSKAGEAFQNMGIDEIVTLEDTQNDPTNQGLAQELYKQTQFLQKLGVASNMTEATKILQAMKDGAFDKLAEDLKSPQQRQEEIQRDQSALLETGNALSARMNTTLLLMANQQGALTRANSIAAANFVERNFNQEDVARMTRMGGNVTSVDGTNTGISTAGDIRTGALEQVVPETALVQTMGRGMREVGGAADKVKRTIGGVVRSGMDMVSSGGNEMQRAIARTDGAGSAMSGQSQQQMLGGKIEMEVVLTDEERNIIVRRDFATTLEDLSRKEKARSEREPGGMVSGS